MNTLTENELESTCGGGEMPVASWPARLYTPAGPNLPASGYGNVTPRQVDN